MNQRLLACSSLTDIPRILLRIGGLKLEKSAHWFRTRRLLTQDSNLFLICANLAPRGDPAGVRIGPNSGDPAGPILERRRSAGPERELGFPNRATDRVRVTHLALTLRWRCH